MDVSKMRETAKKRISLLKQADKLDKEFMSGARKCEFHQPEGGDGPECCHKKQKHIWCCPTTCPRIV